MQERHTNRKKYFEELAYTSKKYYLPYINQFISITSDTKIAEIGCGEGGNLVPFAQLGCSVIGIDIASERIEQAKKFFKDKNLAGTFIASDIFKLEDLKEQFDILIVHDVIEHIEDKENFLRGIQKYLNANGILFMGFPAWQMPFGGHQQICRNRVISHCPFLHLLPISLYRTILKSGKESTKTIEELLSIKQCKTTIELFEKLINKSGYQIVNRTLYFINPHYETKFNLTPKLLPKIIEHIPYFRNYVCTSCFYVLK